MSAPLQTKQIRSSPGSAPSAALDSSVTAGSTLVCLVSFYSSGSNGTITVSDNNGNTWSTTENVSNAADRAAIAYAENANSGATTVTVTSSGTGDQYVTALVAEFPGMLTSGAFDVDISASGTGTSVNTGNTATPAQDNNTVVYVIGTGAATIPASVASGYTALDIEQSSATHQPISCGYKDITSATAQNAALTLTGSSAWVAACAVFKQSGGGGGGGGGLPKLIGSNLLHSKLARSSLVR